MAPFPLPFLPCTPDTVPTPLKLVPFMRGSFQVRQLLIWDLLDWPVQQNISKFLLIFAMETSTRIIDFVFEDLVAIY
jgi:hypothetical protein